MHNTSGLTHNFAPLEEHDAQLVRLGALAEQYFPTDPNTTLLKLRQFAELLAQMTASRVGLLTAPDATFFELLDRLREEDFLPREVSQLFGELRRAGKKTAARATVATATATDAVASTGKSGMGKRGRPKKETGGGTLGRGL